MSEEQESNEKQSGGTYYSTPMEAIEACIDIVTQIYKAKADGFVSAADIFAITGKPRGTMVLKISACVQYGLLSNQHSKGYQVTEAFLAILKPEFEHDVKIRLLETFEKPLLYKKLIERYNSKPLPNQQGISNILSSDFGINENTAVKASSVFLENCAALNLVENGRLRYFIPNTTSDPIKIKKEETAEPAKQEKPKDEITRPKEDANIFTLPIDLGTDRIAYLKYPKDITLDEISTLKIWLEASLKALESRNKKTTTPSNE